MYSDGVIKQYGAEKQKHMPITKSNKNNCPKNAFFSRDPRTYRRTLQSVMYVQWCSVLPLYSLDTTPKCAHPPFRGQQKFLPPQLHPETTATEAIPVCILLFLFY